MIARHSGLMAAVLLASALCLSAGAASAQGQPGATQRSRVVIQVSDAEPAKWNLALNNARNSQTDLGAANVDIEATTARPYAERQWCRSTGATTRGGAGSFARHAALFHADDVDVLPTIVPRLRELQVTLMQRQQQGWAYIRP
jgi:hypothetical protein